MYTGVYRGIQGCTGVNMGIRVYKDVQGFSGGVKGYTGVFKGIQGHSRVYGGICVCIQGYARVLNTIKSAIPRRQTNEWCRITCRPGSANYLK